MIKETFIDRESKKLNLPIATLNTIIQDFICAVHKNCAEMQEVQILKMQLQELTDLVYRSLAISNEGEIAIINYDLADRAYTMALILKKESQLRASIKCWSEEA